MEHLHIRLPADLKSALKARCREQNIAVTSLLIMMISKELREQNLAQPVRRDDINEGPSLGFVLQQ